MDTVGGSDQEVWTSDGRLGECLLEIGSLLIRRRLTFHITVDADDVSLIGQLCLDDRPRPVVDPVRRLEEDGGATGVARASAQQPMWESIPVVGHDR